MKATRRTALAMLGLAPASALGAESFVEPPERPGDVQSVAAGYNKERWAEVFERLAAEIRRDGVDIESLNLSASLNAGAIADTHELKLRFRYKPEA